jgi:hypothetical protein
MNSAPRLPSILDITFGQSAGWNCVWCSAVLTTGAVSAGRAEGGTGDHDLSIEVYACPDCADGHGPAQNPGRRGGDR